MRHLLDIPDLSADEIFQLLADAARLKASRRVRKTEDLPLRGRIIALIFEKPSLRTRVSFESAILQLGGQSLFLPGNDVGLGWRESLADFSRTICQYVDGLVLRVFRHATLQALADQNHALVVNGLSDQAHPCQALADLLTIREEFGDVRDRTVVFVGDGNNVARSLAFGCGKLGARFILSAPPGYGFDPGFRELFARHAPHGQLAEIADPRQAVKNADVVYADVWTSMGQETERDTRLKQFAPYQVNEALMAAAPGHAIVLHCLPAHRGEEITDGVIDSPQSRVFPQAGNRLHAQKALLAWLLG